MNDDAITFDDVLIVPAYSEIETRADIDTSVDFLGLKLRIPIIAANMDFVTGPAMVRAMYNSGGLGILHRFADWGEQLKWMDELDGENIPFMFSVGIRDIDESIMHIAQVTLNFPNAFGVCIDVAHGHHKKVGELVKAVKRGTNLKVLAGNVATNEGAKFLFDAGADAIKVGIGPGSICTTRSVAGVGVPQLTAIIETSEATFLPVVADGGIRNSGDIVKALIAGARVVMLGSLLAGATECPSPTVNGKNGLKYRPYRGQSTIGSGASEGIEGFVPDRGPVEGILKELQAGIQSGMSYTGSANIEELREKGKFMVVSHSTQAENATRVQLEV